LSNSFLFDTNFQRLEAALSAREQLQSVYAANIANADVPNYKADTRSFNDIFHSLYQPATEEGGLVRTNSRHMDVQPSAMPPLGMPSTSGDKSQRLDGNSVDVQKQMEGMAENQLMHEFTVRLLSGEIQDIQDVLKGAK